MDQITLRNVAAEQIYDSYMGILRISPNIIDEQQIDDTTLLFSNPKDGNNDRKLVLSDSDGIELGPYFVPKLRKTNVIIDKNGKTATKNVVNMTFNIDNSTYIVNQYSVRSTLIVNPKTQEAGSRLMPVLVFSKSDTVIGSDTYNVVSYPIESPHDSDYFNNGNKLNLIDYNSTVPVHEQLETALYNKPKSWYDTNIQGKDVVKIDGKVAYTFNKDYEAVPILYTKDYVLGSYSGHTTSNISNDIVSKFFGGSNENNKLKLGSGQSIYSRLSYVQLDGVVWDFMKEILTGDLRHSDGRYEHLGIGQNESITKDLFDKNNVDTELEKNAPMLGLNVAPGTISYHAMPFRRFAFHLMRQELRNKTDDGNVTGSLKTYKDAGKITPIPKKTPGFINTLTKEYILCDGKEINYTNYPAMNTENPVLFQVDDKGLTKRSGTTPLANTTWQSGVNAFSAIKNSDSKGKFRTPHLLATGQTTMRYIRGLNWRETTNKGLNAPIIFTEATPVYTDNDYLVEIVKDSTWGRVKKNISQTGNYRTNVDFKLRKTKHCHYLFYKSAGYNRDAATKNNPNGVTNDVSKLSYGGSGTYSFGTTWGIAYATAKYGIASAPYRPDYWNSDASNPMSISNDGLSQVRYSFNRRAVDAEDDRKHIANHYVGHTPMASAGLWGWKVSNRANKTYLAGDGSTTTANTIPYELNNGRYVIQNAAQSQISTNFDTRYHQLNQMNRAEGLAPIADKGGTDQAKTYYMSIYCEARHHGHLGRKSRYRGSFQAFTGGYALRKDSGGTVTSDIPRCVTSLPIVDLMEEVNNPTKDPAKETAGAGGEEYVTTSNISQPPSINLLPLFKI